jgi:hypothetical protein
MSLKRASEMKEAFKRLQVQSPYKLPKDGPVFTAPAAVPRKEAIPVESPPSGGEKGTEVPPTVVWPSGQNDRGASAPLVENTTAIPNRRSEQLEVESTRGLNDPEVTNTSGTENPRAKSPEVISTRGEINDGLPTPLVETTGGVAHHSSAQPDVSSTAGPIDQRVENTSDSNLENRLNQFLPPGRGQVSWREKGPGSLHIPHQLFEFAQKATSSRNELLIFNCLIRFSLGFHRTSCEAGYSFIAQWTGIDDSANVRKSMKTLLAAGLIVKIREADSVRNIAAVYEIPVVRMFLDPEAKEPGASSSGSGGNSKGVSRPLVDSTRGKSNRSSPGKINSVPEVNSTTKKERINKTLKKATGVAVSLADQLEDAEKRKEIVEEAIRKFESAMTSEAQSVYLDQYEKTEFAHGFLPPRKVMRNMAALHWAYNGSYVERRASC